jgi:hypothetical protein
MAPSRQSEAGDNATEFEFTLFFTAHQDVWFSEGAIPTFHSQREVGTRERLETLELSMGWPRTIPVLDYRT